MATLQRTGITGSLNISGSGASGSIVLNITGSTGTLFIVDDVNSGSLFNVNNSIGLPVMEAFSDGTVKLGKYGVEGVAIFGGTNVSLAGGGLIVSSSGAIFGSAITVPGITVNGSSTFNGYTIFSFNGYTYYPFEQNINGYYCLLWSRGNSN